MERLQKVIAESGFCSRRKAEELIIAGKVLVNGKVVNKPAVSGGIPLSHTLSVRKTG